MLIPKRMLGYAFLAFLVITFASYGLGRQHGYTKWYTPPPVGEVAELLVEEVTDGDTIKVKIHGTTHRVRLMGVNTPETKGKKGVQCHGPEAKARTKALEGKTVKVEFLPIEQPAVKRDKYERLLAYVFVDGKMFNEELVAMGHAHEFKYKGDYKYRDRLLAAQAAAQEKRVGMWKDDACAAQSASKR